MIQARVSRATLLALLSSALACGSTATTEIDAGAKDAGETVDSGSSTDAGAVVDGSDVDTGTPASVRRPFLVGASMRSAIACESKAWSHDERDVVDASAIHAPTRELLFALWLKDGLEEHASIAAFARFSLYLMALGAPADLVARSQRASLDEISHARHCFDLARRYGGKSAGPGALDLRDAITTTPTLEDVAALTAEEGCVGETLGAALALDQLAVAKDERVRALLTRLVADEARHAELAWKFAAWAVRVGGPSVRERIVLASENAIAKTLAAEIRHYDAIDLATFHAHGRLTCEEARASARRSIDEIVRPCLARLRDHANRSKTLETPIFTV